MSQNQHRNDGCYIPEKWEKSGYCRLAKCTKLVTLPQRQKSPSKACLVYNSLIIHTTPKKQGDKTDDV